MISNKRIEFIKEIPTPNDILKNIPLTKKNKDVVINARNEIEKILDGISNKLVVIVGPCSIHNPEAAIEYAKYLKKKIDIYKDNLVIIMRTYFSKPRSSIGWKGYINDPNLDNSFNIGSGLVKSRELLVQILNLGVPCSMEQLDTIVPQYFNDLLSWSAIGARTSESQVHRELASGISTPIGFKNNTEGNVNVAIQGIISCQNTHNFIGCNMDGKISRIKTYGNKYSHIILRGSSKGPNYYEDNIKNVGKELEKHKLLKNIFIDFSHGNSNKDYRNQYKVAEDICQQIKNGNFSIKGCMIESNINEGKQNIDDKPLKYGVSVTDSCINLDTTDDILEILNLSVISRNENY